MGSFLTSHAVFIIAPVVPVLQAFIWNLIVCRKDERSVWALFIVESITLALVRIRFLQMTTRWEYFSHSRDSSPGEALLTLLDVSVRWINVGALSRPHEIRSDRRRFSPTLARLRNTRVDATLIQTWQFVRPSFYYPRSTKALCNRGDVQKWKNVKKELTLL